MSTNDKPSLVQRKVAQVSQEAKTAASRDVKAIASVATEAVGSGAYLYPL